MLGVVSLGLAGCHSAYVEAVVKNHSGGPISVLEVDYPSASFGTESLASGQEFHYRFKTQGEGPLKVLWTDEHHQDYTVTGPVLHEGAEGTLAITLQPNETATFALKLKP
jgi:hypothetical protein